MHLDGRRNGARARRLGSACPSLTTVSDLLIRNARLVPVHGELMVQALVDVLVQGGTVTQAVAGLERPDGVEEIDADGRWLAPGLWDQHAHLTQWVEGRKRLDLAGAGSVEEAAAIVARRLADEPGKPVVGWGHRSAFMGRDGTTAELDAVSTEVPIVLISGDGHHAWANSLGFTQLGLPVRDDVVRENEWFDAYPRLGVIAGRTDTPEAYREALGAAAALGVVGVVDFEFNGRREPWVERWNDGCDLLRVRWATYAAGLDEVLEAGLRTGDPLPGADDRLTMGPLKIISDGSLNTRTAWCCDPYADAATLEHPAGLPNQTAADLRAMLGRATQGGLEVATHAIGDAAVADALLAYAETGAAGSVEHAQLVRRDDVPLLAGSGCAPASSRPTCSTTATSRSWSGPAGGTGASRSAGCWTPGSARPRLGRAGLTAGPVARDLRRRAPQRRRPRPLARRAGPHAGGGVPGVGRRAAERRRRVAGRPRPARPQPAGDRRDDDRDREGAPGDAGRPHGGGGPGRAPRLRLSPPAPRRPARRPRPAPRRTGASSPPDRRVVGETLDPRLLARTDVVTGAGGQHVDVVDVGVLGGLLRGRAHRDQGRPDERVVGGREREDLAPDPLRHQLRVADEDHVGVRRPVLDPQQCRRQPLLDHPERDEHPTLLALGHQVAARRAGPLRGTGWGTRRTAG